MLSALKPNESVYDITKFYKNLSRIKLKKQPKNPLNKLSLPKLTGSKILEQNLSKILTISCKNSVKINKVNLKYTNNLQNNSNEIKKEENYIRSPVLSESNKNIKLPKLQKKKKIFSENNSPQKPQKNFSCLYLKYEGENYYNEVNKKIYIKIFPQKIIHSIKNIMSNDKNIINKIEEKINKIMVDKSTTMSNLNMDFKTITVNLNEIVDSEENKYILLTENNNKSNKHLFRIKNIFLENIIQNVITHSIEIRNQKNQIILRGEIENELNNQLNLLKQFFVNEVNNRKHERYSEYYNKIDIKTIKMIRTQKHLLKTYNKIISSNFDESENYIDSVINKRDEGYLTERNNGNKEIFNLFKTKLDITKTKTFHDLYYNIITTNSSFNHNYITSTQTTSNYEHKKLNTNSNINKKKEINKDINKNKESILNFYKNYLNIKEDLNINNDKKAQNQEYIFKFKPNLKFVEFKEIIDEINDININKKLNINKSINNEQLFFLMMSDESLLKEINFQNMKNKNISKFFSDKIKKSLIPTKKNKNIKSNLRIDVLQTLGDKLHKKLKIKLGRNKRRKNIKYLLSNKTGIKSKSNNDENINKSRLTENKYIDTETNSSVFSDIPSDLSMSYSEMKKQKEENHKRIKKVFENQDIFNDANIIDIDELFFKVDKPEEKNNIDNNNKNKSKEISNNEDSKDNEEKENEINEDKEGDKDTFIVYDNKDKSVNKNVNITNLMIKDKIKKRKIKYIYVNNDLQQIKSKFNDKSKQTNTNLLNNEKDKSNINNNLSSSKNITRNSIKVDTIKNVINKSNKSHSNKKEIDEQKNEKSTSKKKIKIDRKSINKINTRRNKYSKNKTNKSNYSEKNSNENDIENDVSNIAYDQLIQFFNNKFNIPGKNNKIKKNYLSKSTELQTNNYKGSFYNESKYKKETFMNYIKGIQKDKLIKNKSFSFIKTRNDKKLILLKPILRHILFRKNTNLKKIRDTLNKMFNVYHVDILDINFDDKPNNQKKRNSYKKMISFDDDGNYKNYCNHRALAEKYLGSRLKIEQNYYLDDIDLLLENKYGIKKKIYKRKKGNNKKGFKQFMNDDINAVRHNYLDDFEERQKENDRIRSYIEAEKEKKKRRIKAAEDKFNIFKSYINSLKNMTEEQLKFDAIRFIYKIKSDENNILKTNRIKRINDFKKYIKSNEMNKLNNNKSILKNIYFQSNCVFHTDKLFNL